MKNLDDLKKEGYVRQPIEERFFELKQNQIYGKSNDFYIYDVSREEVVTHYRREK